jgi:hypothetical protein
MCKNTQKIETYNYNTHKSTIIDKFDINLKDFYNLEEIQFRNFNFKEIGPPAMVPLDIRLKSFKDDPPFKKLTVLHVSSIYGLPYPEQVPNLEKLVIEDCVDDSLIPVYEKLKILCLKNVSKKLYSLPLMPKLENLECSSSYIRELPEYPLLKSLILDYNSSLKNVPFIETLKMLKIIYNSQITELPDYPNLDTLSVNSCASLVLLPNSPGITELNVNNCPLLTNIPSILSNLKTLRVVNCDNLRSLHDLKSTKLRKLHFRNNGNRIVLKFPDPIGIPNITKIVTSAKKRPFYIKADWRSRSKTMIFMKLLMRHHIKEGYILVETLRAPGDNSKPSKKPEPQKVPSINEFANFLGAYHEYQNKLAQNRPIQNNPVQNHNTQTNSNQIILIRNLNKSEPKQVLYYFNETVRDLIFGNR